MSNDLVLVIALGALFLGIAGVLAAIVGGASRSKGVSSGLAALQNVHVASRPLRERDLQRPFGDRVVDPLFVRLTSLGRLLTPRDRLQRITRRLDLAGNPAGWDADRVIGLKVLGTVAGGLVGLAVPWTLRVGALPTIGLAVLGAVLGWLGPTMWLYQVGYNRSERIQRDLPDAMDLLTISVEAGLGFDAALAQVARNNPGPLGQELFRVLQEMQIGTGRLDALRALGERSDVPELRTFTAAMVQADGFGIPVADVLRVQSREMRTKRSQRAEERAQQVPVKILFPLILCIMPALFIVVIGPAAIGIVHTFSGR